MTQESNDNELNELAPKLTGLKKQRTYSAPEGYFDQLKAKVQERAAHLQEGTVIELNNYWRPIAAACAVAAMLVVSFSLFESDVEHEQQVIAYEDEETIDPGYALIAQDEFYGIEENTDHVIEVDVEEASEYVDEVILGDIDEEDILLAMTEVDWDWEDETDVEVADDDEIIEYLMMEGIDLDLILAEL